MRQCAPPALDAVGVGDFYRVCFKGLKVIVPKAA
jgi:hypothetical protein